MIDWIVIVGSMIAGILLGLAYFGGLWWTVNRMRNAHHPLGFYLASMFVRNFVMVAVLFLILQMGVLPLLAALIALFGVRMVFVRLLGPVRQANVKTNLESRIG